MPLSPCGWCGFGCLISGPWIARFSSRCLYLIYFLVELNSLLYLWDNWQCMQAFLSPFTSELLVIETFNEFYKNRGKIEIRKYVDNQFWVQRMNTEKLTKGVKSFQHQKISFLKGIHSLTIFFASNLFALFLKIITKKFDSLINWMINMSEWNDD